MRAVDDRGRRIDHRWDEEWSRTILRGGGPDAALQSVQTSTSGFTDSPMLSVLNTSDGGNDGLGTIVDSDRRTVKAGTLR